MAAMSEGRIMAFTLNSFDFDWRNNVRRTCCASAAADALAVQSSAGGRPLDALRWATSIGN
jgi:hypothetical protein